MKWDKEIRQTFPFLQTRHIEETDCLQKIIESSFSNKNLFTYMLYDTSIEETRCWKKKRTKNKMNEREREKNVRSTVHRSLPVQDEVSSSGCEG